eukprot:scaffold667343_cov51-Prasinocladus_malaysianus.AAC.1
MWVYVVISTGGLRLGSGRLQRAARRMSLSWHESVYEYGTDMSGQAHKLATRATVEALKNAAWSGRDSVASARNLQPCAMAKGF